MKFSEYNFLDILYHYEFFLSFDIKVEVFTI